MSTPNPSETAQSFLKELFDFSFSRFITLRFIKLLFIVGLVAIGVVSIFFALSGFTRGFGQGLLTLLLSPVLFLAYTIFFRIWLELVVVIFRIADNTRHLVPADQTASSETPSAVEKTETPDS